MNINQWRITSYFLSESDKIWDESFTPLYLNLEKQSVPVSILWMPAKPCRIAMNNTLSKTNNKFLPSHYG